MNNFIAHIRGNDGVEQLLVNHLKEVQQIAEDIGQKIGIPHVTGLAGMLHDMGKYSDDFQNYLREAVANPDNPPKRGSVNHSTAGGKFLMERYHKSFQPNTKVSPLLIESVANAIYSHHGQLLDMVGTDATSPFMDRLDPTKSIDFENVVSRFLNEMYDQQYMNNYILQANKEIGQYLQRTAYKFKTKDEQELFLLKTMTFITKFVFSTLIDADRQNSRDFEEQTNQATYNSEELFRKFEQELDKQLQNKQQHAIPNDITKLRQQMSDQCFEKATLPTGIYTLSIPTGGGKTLASLRFALKHAKQYNKKKIIYVVPYTTIIEQNAEEVRNVLHAHDYVLEHHSNVITKEIENDDIDNFDYQNYQRMRTIQRAKDDWDIPIVFTTIVQFLNTFYDGTSRSTRRLHNLAESIIIFDEVQTVPVQCVSLFNEALNFLKTGCHTTILLCTATQPALEYVEKNIQVDSELIEDLPHIIQAFKRTNIVPLLKTNGWTTDELEEFAIEKVEECGNLLIILNTKKEVKKLYDALCTNGEQVYHLSTAMCPAHRKNILKDIREKLFKGERVICVSTQLIEAGVDISFNSVIRSLAGLDSIAQAAGRCNRHGEVGLRDVYVINHAEETLNKLETIEKGRECSKYILTDLEKHPELFNGSLLSVESMEHYFKMFYSAFEGKLNYPINDLNTNLHELLFGKNAQFKSAHHGQRKFSMCASFKTAANHFEVIEANTYAILVPYDDEGQELISTLTGYEKVTNFNQFVRKAQQYSVNVFRYEFEKLIANQLIREVNFGFSKIYVATDSAYDEKNGLHIEGDAAFQDYQV